MFHLGEDFVNGTMVQEESKVIICDSEEVANRVMEMYKDSNLDIKKISKEKKGKGRGANRIEFFVVKATVDYSIEEEE